MKIAALVHFSPPWRNAGSETVVVELLKAAVVAGHEVRLWCTHENAQRSWRGNEPDTRLEGFTVHRVRNVLIGGQQIGRWRPDVLTTHHDHATYGVKLARQIGARSVYLTHNEVAVVNRALRLKPSLVIHNSDWVRRSLNKQFGPDEASMTFHPPLTADRHKVKQTGEAVTLINHNADKGGEIFFDLARRMPERSFVAVEGGHGIQVKPPRLPNLTVLEHGPDMKRVWEQTRILVMPSVAESYGLTAVEAGINGIPTIAHPTPGLKENLGAGGLFCDRDKPRQWVRAIRQLDDPDTYRDASKYAQGLADDALKATRDTLKQWCQWVG